MRRKNNKKLDLLEEIYPDDSELNIVDWYIENLELKKRIEIKGKINISWSHTKSGDSMMKNDYFGMFDELRLKRSSKYQHNPNVIVIISKNYIGNSQGNCEK